MDITRSIEYLLAHAGPVIRWRLHREILRDLAPEQEAALLQEVYATPAMQELLRHHRPGGFDGDGLHGGGAKGSSLLQDGESAARLLANAAIPPSEAVVRDLLSILRDEAALTDTFLHRPADAARLAVRHRALGCGGGIMTVVYALRAMLGDEGDDVQQFAQTSYAAFARMAEAQSLADMTHRDAANRRYNYPYVEEDELFPCQYHLETLAVTQSWRTPERVATVARAVDRINEIMKPDDGIHVRIGRQRLVPYWAYCRTIKPFDMTDAPHTALRKTLTCLAMATGDRTQVVQQSVASVMAGLQEDGVLRIAFSSAYRRKQFRDGLGLPTAYSEVGLEPSHRSDTALWCEMTFWAVQLLHLTGHAEWRGMP